MLKSIHDAILAILAAAFALTLGSSTLAQAASPAIGSVFALTGHVTLKHASSNDERAATLRAPVLPNDLVTTAANSSVILRLANGETLRMGARTSLRLTEYVVGKKEEPRTVSLDLLVGRLRLWTAGKLATSSYNIRTNNSVAGVRGTEFELGFDPQQESTLVAVLEGAVSFKNPTSTAGLEREIPAGFWGEIRGKEDPTVPVPLANPPAGFTLLGR